MAVLVLLAATAIAQVPPVAAVGDWSRPVLRSTDPVPLWVAAGCAALLAPAVAIGLWQVVRRVQGFRRLRRDCRRLGQVGPLGALGPLGQVGPLGALGPVGPLRRLGRPGRLDMVGQVVVLDSERPEAFATPAGGGRIVVTSGLLRALSADEQQVLFAHESAHLRHRHAWWVLAAQLCAVVNPTLRGVARATGQTVERWADESAAIAVGDRRLAARALARAALHVSAAQRPATVGVVDGDVPQRVRALLAPAPRPRRVAVAVLVALLVGSIGCATAVQRRTDAFFDSASTPEEHHHSQRFDLSRDEHHARELLRLVPPKIGV